MAKAPVTSFDNFILFLIKMHKMKKRNYTNFFFLTQFFIFQTFFILLFGLILCPFWLSCVVRFGNFDCNSFNCFALSIKQTAICIFLRLYEGHITIPTDSHQLQSNHLQLKFLINTIFFYRTTIKQREKKC